MMRWNDGAPAIVAATVTAGLLQIGACTLAFAQSAPAVDAGDGAILLDTIGVTGNGSGSPLVTDGYVTQASPVGSKTETPIVEIPQSISTVTRAQLDDRNVQTLSEAVLYTPGVRVGTAGFDPRFDSFYVRGFDATYTGIYRDGLRELNGNFSIFKTEPYGLEGLSVLKGPASSLYGGGSPGGIIDLTTKRPTFTPFKEIEAQIGSQDRYQGQFDVGGPIEGSEEWAYRLTGLARKANSQLMGTADDKISIAPAVTWRPSDATSLTLLGEYSNIQTGGNTAYFNSYDANGIPSIGRLFSGDPAYDDFIQNQYRIGYAFEHNFNANLAFRQNFRYAHIDAHAEYTDIVEISPDGLSASRMTGLLDDRLDTLALDNQLQARLSTGPVAHTLLAGVDIQYADGTDRWSTGTAPDLDLTILNYGQQPIPEADVVEEDTRQMQRQVGVYLQDQARLGPLVLTMGVRNDWVNTDTDDRLNGGTASQADHKLTERIGLTYLGPYGLSPYASYATSFAPVLGSDAQGNPFVPTTGEQVEAGIKVIPPGMNMMMTAAIFDITQQNVVRTDPDNLNQQIQTGEIRSRGIELEATGSLGNGLSFTASYTYLDLEIVQGEPGTDGNVPSAIPPQQAAIWTSYAFQPGSSLAGVTAGAGLRYNGESYGNDENTFKNDAELLVDAELKVNGGAIDPRWTGLEFQLNARNLLDTDSVACESGYCYRGEGRAILAGLRYKW